MAATLTGRLDVVKYLAERAGADVLHLTKVSNHSLILHYELAHDDRFTWKYHVDGM